MSSFSAIHVPVKDISPNLRLWYVRVQVIRLWNVTFCNHPSRVHSVELVLIDAQGNNIQASVNRDVLRMKRIDMYEGGCFDISRAVVVANDGKDRPTNHPYRMTSLWVELLSGLTSEREYVKDENDMVVLYLEIIDPTGNIECVLYNDYVEDVRQYLKNEGGTTPIIVIQFARIVNHGPVFFGDAAIESVVGITRVMFSPGIPEVFDMRNWLAMSGLTLDAKLNFRDLETPNISLRDEFLPYHPRRDLRKLLTKGEAGIYVIWATITSILKNDTWWYTVAKHHACSTQGSTLFNCDGYYTVIPRFKLKVEACDGTDITYLMLGDEDLPRLLNTSCKELLATLRGEDTSAHPAIFNRLIGQHMLFLVEKRTGLCHVKDACFKVKRVCVEAEIIRMYLCGQFFRLDRNTRSTIGRLLGKQGVAEYFNVPEGSSHGSGLLVDNFMSTGSEIGPTSLSSSVSMNKQAEIEKSDSHIAEPMDKQCVYFTTSSD
ncbi:Nucleic acid-binding, OB-fold [Sesbania bispinosa]|nr:Nucleic acid-binding, OB-fold [Sesbania bispinosa]